MVHVDARQVEIAGFGGARCQFNRFVRPALGAAFWELSAMDGNGWEDSSMPPCADTFGIL